MHKLSQIRLIGMVHLAPLPGAPGFRGTANSGRTARNGRNAPIDQVARQAVTDATLLEESGFDAVMVENYGDHPFHACQVPAETIAAMAVVISRIADAVRCPIGVNVLRNDARSALGIAAVTGASFIRVNVHSGVMATDQGILTGMAADTLRARAELAPGLCICADVHVKHAVPISQPDLVLAASDTAYRAMADCLIVSGAGTGKATDTQDIARVKQAVPDRPVWVGSGATADTSHELLRIADGLIVGTCLKQGGVTDRRLDHKRVAAFVRAANRK